MATTFNPNELILERVKSVLFTDYSTGDILARLTQLEESTLETTSETDEVLDAIGSPIDRIQRSKAATFSASNSLFSLDLAAQQFGTDKQVASSSAKIKVPAEEIKTVNGTAHTVTLTHTPVEGSVKQVYLMNSKNLAEKYTLTSSNPTEKQFTIAGNVITFAEGVTSGDFYVTYEYEAEAAVRVDNKAENFPKTTGFKAFALFKDPCNPENKYMGVIVAKRAQLDASSISLALQFDGKHPFTVNFNKEYCEDNADLFSIIIPGE